MPSCCVDENMMFDVENASFVKSLMGKGSVNYTYLSNLCMALNGIFKWTKELRACSL